MITKKEENFSFGYFVERTKKGEETMFNADYAKELSENPEARKEEFDILFPPASAEEVWKLMADIGRDGNEEKPVMVDTSGQRNIVSRFDPRSRGKATHDNLLDVISVEGKDV